MILVEGCSCGYRGHYWYRHVRLCLRWGHDPANHKYLGLVGVDDDYDDPKPDSKPWG